MQSVCIPTPRGCDMGKAIHSSLHYSSSTYRHISLPLWIRWKRDDWYWQCWRRRWWFWVGSRRTCLQAENSVAWHYRIYVWHEIWIIYHERQNWNIPYPKFFHEWCWGLSMYCCEHDVRPHRKERKWDRIMFNKRKCSLWVLSAHPDIIQKSVVLLVSCNSDIVNNVVWMYDAKGSLGQRPCIPSMLWQPYAFEMNWCWVCSIYLLHLDPPSPLKSGTKYAFEGGSVILSLPQRSNPPPHVYTWKREGNEVEMSSNTPPVISNIRRSDAGMYIVRLTNLMNLTYGGLTEGHGVQLVQINVLCMSVMVDVWCMTVPYTGWCGNIILPFL